MCAIAGLIDCGEPSLLEAMMRVQSHRGPDSNGALWFPELGSGLSHCRLAILDLSPAGHQPMSSDERHWIVFNGEIYNFESIRDELRQRGFEFRSRCDTEVILRAYECWGADCLRHFNGMFAFAILDRVTGAVFAARDHIGIKPFYYWHSGNQLAFASEIKALLELPFVPRRPDYEGLLTPARFQVSPLTGFEGIQKLAPGHSLSFKRGSLTLHRYWEVNPTEHNSDDATEVDELDALLKDAVRLQMIADRPVGTFLSGGLDSSLISALMRANTDRDLHAFTIAFSEADQKFERMPDDAAYAKRVARDLDFKFHEFVLEPNVVDLLPKMVWHLDEPLSDPAAINTFMISQAARDLGIVVLLNGVGGDEIFGGYRKHLACLKADAYQAFVPGIFRNAIEKTFDRIPVASGKQGFRYLRWAKRFASFASLPQAERYLAADLSLAPAQFEALFPGSRYHDSQFFRAQEPRLARRDLGYLTRMCWNDTCVFLPEHNLTYADKAAMAASIETRPPLTDYRIVEKMFSLAPRFRIRGNTQKWLMKKVGERYLPAEIVHRPKAPFNAPLRAWIRGPLVSMVDDLLSAESLRSRALWDADYVRRRIQNDRCGREDNGMLIWTLLTQELWFRTFFGSSTGKSGSSPIRQVVATAPAVPAEKR
ncbi:MAG TPA: asparagine synthase (glutamine-hydrolyzing) [Candidatus Acidoferrum sp.]|nr:asparagine synthase (glutamine-hydrolyzing) [Candidatus Acidoferrum sp.]